MQNMCWKRDAKIIETISKNQSNIEPTTIKKTINKSIKNYQNLPKTTKRHIKIDQKKENPIKKSIKTTKNHQTIDKNYQN